MISNNRVIRHVPNAITLLNLVAGCLSIVSAFEGNLQMAGVFILIAAVFDYLDGFTARLIGAYTMLGKELDSLSDVVSFGVAPSMILFHLLKKSRDRRFRRAPNGPFPAGNSFPSCCFLFVEVRNF